MVKFAVILICAIVASSHGMSFRHRRQATNNEDNVEDRYGWNGPGRGTIIFFPMPNNQQRPTNPPATTQASNNNNNNNGGNAANVQTCVASCPQTSEYNPVCGTDLVRYNNPSHLACAQMCGVTVSVLRLYTCPTATTVPPSS